MPRIDPVEYDDASPEARALHDDQVARHGRITNMKRTLLHSPSAFHALMEWYTLRDAVLPFLGERLVNLYSHAISIDNDCLICSTFFRRILIDAGENPDDLTLDGREQAIVDYGRALAKPFARVPQDLYERMAVHFTHEQVVALTAFGALMIATNVFNNALEVPFDDYLQPYRKQPDKQESPR